MDTKQKIIDASMHIFTERGYLKTSTKAIAKEASVSEMTLFRKFKTKQNLFETMLKYTLGNDLSKPDELDITLPLSKFTKQLLHNRLLLISEHINLVQMMIQESLQGRLTDDLNFIDVMSTKLKHIFENYFETHNLPNQSSITKILLGIVLNYAIIESNVNYHLLSKEDQDRYVTNLLRTLNL